MQLALFTSLDHAALRARAAAGEYLTRPIWRGIWEAGRQHGRAGGQPLPRNRYGAAQPTPHARAALDGYFGDHMPNAPMNRHDADMFEAGRRFGAAERKGCKT